MPFFGIQETLKTMEWLTHYSKALTAATSVLTLFVWFFYAQILYRNFARTRRPRIIINRGQGNDLSSLCLISNMSSEPIFLEHIITTLHTSKGRFTEDMIDFEGEHDSDNDDEQKSDGGNNSSQGPMLSGSYSHIGSFSSIVSRICGMHGISLNGNCPTDDTQLQQLDIRVIAIYGSEDDPIGASRRFSLTTDDDGHCTLTPVSVDTKRYANRYQRWRVRRWIRRLDQRSIDG